MAISFWVCVLAVLAVPENGHARPMYGEIDIRYGNDERHDMWATEGVYGEEPAMSVLLLNGTGWQSGIGEAMTVTSLPPRGDEIWQLHEDHRNEVREEEEMAYQEQLDQQHELEWEYLHLPMRSYPGFFDYFQLQTLFPQMEVMFSRIHYVFWILSGGILTVGMVWHLSHANSGREAVYAVAGVLLLILVMGVSAKCMRWADYFVYDVADVLGNMVAVTEQEESHYSHLVKVFHGINVSLDRARERIWREQDTPRSRMAGFFEPISKAMGEMVDWLVKGGYYIGCLLLSVLVLIVLLILAILEQARLFLLYLGYSITPLLIGGLTVPLLRGGVRMGIQNLLAVLCWPIGWVVCFLVGNVLAQRIVFAFQETPPANHQEWYHPSVLAVHIWRAFYEDRHGMFFGVALGVCVLSVGLSLGIWWVSRNLHLAIAGYSGVVLKSVGSSAPMQAMSVSTAGAYRWVARMVRDRGNRQRTIGGEKPVTSANEGAPVSVPRGAAKVSSLPGSPSAVRNSPLMAMQSKAASVSRLRGMRRFQTRIRNRK